MGRILKKDKPKLLINWATFDAANFACKHWHYSGSIPVPPRVLIGVWEDNQFIGVVIFSRGASANLYSPYGLSQTEGCELTRVALKGHKTPVSRIVSIAIKFLKKHNPGLKLIVSFADPMHRHHGGIYQAGNWIYCGVSSETKEWLDVTGKRWHSRQISGRGMKKQFGEMRVKKVVKTSDCLEIKCPGKYRYLMPLDDETKERLKVLAKPYPKSAASKDSVASVDQTEKGGASPTVALHIQNK